MSDIQASGDNVGGTPTKTKAVTEPDAASSLIGEDTSRVGKGKSDDIVIYYFPTSFSSQKVLISLYEREVKFTPKIVSLFHGQHMEPWYVRLNPDGAHVPVLVHGEKIINNPDKIIEYIDKLPGCEPQLVPRKFTEIGQKVSKFISTLSHIPVDVISYGIIFHPDLSGGRCQLPLAIQRSMRENFTNRLRYLITLSTIYPDLRDCYLAKSQTAAEKYDLINDEDRVRGHIDQLNSFLTTVEDELRVKYGLKEDEELKSANAQEIYLYGDCITLADIGLYVFITRLQILGLLPQSVPSSRFPLIHRHFMLMSGRPSIGQLLNEVSKLKYTLIMEDIKASASYVGLGMGAGMVLMASFFLIKKLQQS